MSEDLTKLSASRVSMILDKCPKQFEFRYVRGIISPPGGALVLGGAVHKGAEAQNRYKMAMGEDAPEEVLLDAYSDEFDLRAKNEDGPEVEWGEDDPGKLKDTGITVTKAYRALLAPRIKPVAAEREFRVAIPDTDFTLHGFIDCEDEDGYQRDLKTAGRMTPQKDADRNTQMGVYAYAAELEGKPAKGGVLDVVTKAREPKVATLHCTEATAELGRRRVHAALGVIQSGLFPPNTGTWACNSRWCGFWSRCEYGGG